MQFVLPSGHKVGQQSYEYSPSSEYFSGTGAGLKQRPVANCRCPPTGHDSRQDVTDLVNLVAFELRKA